ncbi:hypothetical protein J4448_01560 [Candidatus Woesearchaeota archaeon]|nr:hypothetical protein [Candidatus Woesearchaeota archaeon]
MPKDRFSKLECINLKKGLLYFLIFALSINLVLAHTEDFAEAKKLIDAKTPCSQLTENQLEILGDYLMEQMHPGEAHELMDRMMGGEGSATLRQTHINMARRLYCNENINMMSGGMMNMMNYNFGYGMMGSGYGLGYWGFLNFLSLVLVIGLIILVYL